MRFLFYRTTSKGTGGVMTFYLGAPEPSWISMTERPLFVSHTRLRRIRSGFSFPVSYPGGKWVVDSGAYDLITRHGRHLDTPEHYVRAVRSYDVRIGNLQWAAPQDWPTEDAALAGSGATVAEHIDRSVQSYLDVTAWWQRLAPGSSVSIPAGRARQKGQRLSAVLGSV